MTDKSSLSLRKDTSFPPDVIEAYDELVIAVRQVNKALGILRANRCAANIRDDAGYWLADVKLIVTADRKG